MKPMKAKWIRNVIYLVNNEKILCPHVNMHPLTAMNEKCTPKTLCKDIEKIMQKIWKRKVAYDINDEDSLKLKNIEITNENVR